jgi:hypothetical protein
MRLWIIDPLTAAPPLIPLYLQVEVKTVQTQRQQFLDERILKSKFHILVKQTDCSLFLKINQLKAK